MEFKAFNLKADDGEGAIHQDVPHRGIDAQGLEDRTNRQRATFPSNTAPNEGHWAVLSPHRKLDGFTPATLLMRTHLRCDEESGQELANLLESAAAVQAVKDQADQAYVVQGARC